MAKPALKDVPSTIEGWDVWMTFNIQTLRDGPLPVKEYDNATGLPAANANDRCLAFKQITSGLNPGWRPAFSDGAAWRYLPDNTQAYFDDGAIRQGAAPSATGAIRISNTTDVKRRNNAGLGDLDVIKADAGDTVTVGSTGGDTRTPAGASVALAKIGGTIDAQTATVGNPATTAEGDLMTYTLPANALSANGKGIVWKLLGKLAANGNDKRIKIKFGSVTVFDSGVVTDNGVRWSAELVVYRTASNAQKIAYKVWKGTALVAHDVAATTETDSAGIILKATGTSPTTGAASDVTQESDLKQYAA